MSENYLEKNSSKEEKNKSGQEAPDLNKFAEAVQGADSIKTEDIFVGEELEIVTQNSTYVLVRKEDGFYISGGKYPSPLKVRIDGSSMGGAFLSLGSIVGGLRLEFTILDPAVEKKKILTSAIRRISIRKLGPSQTMQ